MPEVNDKELVAEFLDRKSEAAFALLARRHINLVYSVALRWVGNGADAQDVTQAVFIVLARKAGSLRGRATLTGWLYETTRFTAARLARTRSRQAAREQEAYMQSTLNETDTGGVWRQMAPLLEEGMSRLSEDERTLLALRFFENKSGAETAALLGIKEWAAHKRSARALEKLRKFFQGRGVVSTTAIIAGAMAENSVQAAPVALANSVSALALAQGAAVGGTTLALVKGVLKVMAWTKVQTAIIGTVVVSLAALSVGEHRAQIKLREQNEGLQQQLDQAQMENERLAAKSAQAAVPQLPAPAMQVSQVAAPVEAPATNSLYERLKDKYPQLTHEQVEAFLKANGRTAATLLAAFRTSGDRTLLAEAAEKFPNDPHVAFEAAIDMRQPAADKRAWLDAFERVAPENALGNYLSALSYFNSGQTDKAVQELSAASGKRLDDYSLTRMQEDDEAFLAAGYSTAEAKQMASMSLLLPQLSQVKQVGIDTIDLAKAYQQSGDAASAQAALQMAVNLGSQYSTPAAGEPTISQLVGIWVEKAALSAMDPNAPVGNTGATAQDEVNRLTQQRASVSSLAEQSEALMPQVSDQDWIVYKDRWMMFGEQNAEQWVVNKYGKK